MIVRLKSLLKYVYGKSVEDDSLVESIDTKVKAFNQNKDWKEQSMGFMSLEHHYAAQVITAREEGLEQGREESAVRYSKLIDLLLDAHRIDDLKRAADDNAYRESLFKELNI